MQHTGHNYYFDRKYQISWSTAKKVLPLYQLFPPRLFTMRTRAELFLYTYGNIRETAPKYCRPNGNIEKQGNLI